MVSKYGMDYSGTGYRYWRVVVVVVMYFEVHKMSEFLEELGKNRFSIRALYHGDCLANIIYLIRRLLMVSE
jgi:hypothetical protein